MRVIFGSGLALAAAMAGAAHSARGPMVAGVSASLSPSQVTTRLSPAPRLPVDVLNITPPSNRVEGAPGSMRVTRTTCPAPVALTPDLRQRLVDITVQEWAFFGYGIVDQTIGESDEEPPPPSWGRRGRPRIRLKEPGWPPPSAATGP